LGIIKKIKLIISAITPDRDREKIRESMYNSVRNSTYTNPFLLSDEAKERNQPNNLLVPYERVRELRKKGVITNKQIDESYRSIMYKQLGKAYSTRAFKRMTDHKGKTPEYWNNLMNTFKENKKKRKRR